MNPGKYVVFGLGEESFGLPIENVEQILKSPTITKVPRASKDIVGLFSLRGSTIPVVNTSNILSVPATGNGYLLVALVEDVRAAFLVDQVHRIVDLTSDQIEESDDLAESKLSTHCGSTKDGMIVLLQPKACLPMKEIQKAKSKGEPVAA